MSPAAHFNDLIQTLMPDAKVFAGYGHDPMIDASNLKFSAFSFLVTPRMLEWQLFYKQEAPTELKCVKRG